MEGHGAPCPSVGFSHVTELRPWETFAAGPRTITAAPAAHAGPTKSSLIEGRGKTVYCAGETACFPDLVRRAERFPRLDLAVLPVDGLRLRWGK